MIASAALWFLVVVHVAVLAAAVFGHRRRPKNPPPQPVEFDRVILLGGPLDGRLVLVEKQTTNYLAIVDHGPRKMEYSYSATGTVDLPGGEKAKMRKWVFDSPGRLVEVAD